VNVGKIPVPVDCDDLCDEQLRVSVARAKRRTESDSNSIRKTISARSFLMAACR